VSVSSSEIYLSPVFAYDKQIMNQKITYEEVVNRIVILRDHFNKTFRELEDMANAQSVVAMEGVKAQH
jgi:hypothetical protein